MIQTASTYCQSTLNATFSGTCVDTSSTGKERDEETGYGYFGARYMEHELMTMWLSVDPLADKYPSISPYAFCAWNPVKLVDPDGRDTIKINVDNGTISLTKADGGHSIQYYKKDQLLRTDNYQINKCQFALSLSQLPYQDDDGEQKQSNTTFLKCSNSVVGKQIFHAIAEIGSSVEWDYYSREDGGYGELSSSGLANKMIHNAGRYYNWKTWDHYHPDDISDNFYPSYSDQNNARNNHLVSTIHFSGKSMRFDNWLKGNGVYWSLHEFTQLWTVWSR